MIPRVLIWQRLSHRSAAVDEDEKIWISLEIFGDENESRRFAFFGVNGNRQTLQTARGLQKVVTENQDKLALEA